MKFFSFLRSVGAFAIVAACLGAPSAMPPVDAADMERMQANAQRIAAAKAEFKRRIDLKWPGYEQDGPLSSPLALSSNTNP